MRDWHSGDKGSIKYVVAHLCCNTFIPIWWDQEGIVQNKENISQTRWVWHLHIPFSIILMLYLNKCLQLWRSSWKTRKQNLVLSKYNQTTQCRGHVRIIFLPSCSRWLCSWSLSHNIIPDQHSHHYIQIKVDASGSLLIIYLFFIFLQKKHVQI